MDVVSISCRVRYRVCGFLLASVDLGACMKCWMTHCMIISDVVINLLCCAVNYGSGAFYNVRDHCVFLTGISFEFSDFDWWLIYSLRGHLLSLHKMTNLMVRYLLALPCILLLE